METVPSVMSPYSLYIRKHTLTNGLPACLRRYFEEKVPDVEQRVGEKGKREKVSIQLSHLAENLQQQKESFERGSYRTSRSAFRLLIL